MRGSKAGPGRSAFRCKALGLEGLGADLLPPSTLRVLWALREAWAEGPGVSWRGLLASLRRAGGGGHRSPKAVQDALARLRAAGLVTWERGRVGTLKPTCIYHRR
jgi:hypothetical protein